MTKAAGEVQKTPLEERLIEMIKLKGPITIADYMSDALGHPHDGYYMTNTPIGATGDFTTAPEISQVFGELIGLWLVDAWRGMGSPKSFNLIELGPGRGVLMEDMLRAARLRPEFTSAANLWLLETSGRLRVEQQKRLRASEVKPLWADDLSDIAPAPSLIVANEFFDCLPIRQFQILNGAWRERLVGLNSAETSLDFVHDATPPPEDFKLPDPSACAEGDIFEVSFSGRSFTAEICAILKEHGGHALIIDYGHMQSGLGDTFQAVRKHEYWPPLQAPGAADITAHVDFQALSQIAIDQGVSVHGTVTQGLFLENLGLNLRLEMLAKGKTPEEEANIRAGVHRIAAPSQMGEIFKVVCFSAPQLPSPAGFETV